ncbi:putative glycosyltransferase At5g20260-like protein [Anopheles sinensis]|uniref:Putative glycosyltransferase At5g20260-like protein n=1 Tax=Anopheles sinensis TaxID=74873 RepID=A0A084WDF5_ANOSI|nr:putative glycosyltransferase At5g20260-like protein [Anopheles sinensis]
MAVRLHNRQPATTTTISTGANVSKRRVSLAEGTPGIDCGPDLDHTVWTQNRALERWLAFKYRRFSLKRTKRQEQELPSGRTRRRLSGLV